MNDRLVKELTVTELREIISEELAKRNVCVPIYTPFQHYCTYPYQQMKVTCDTKTRSY